MSDAGAVLFADLALARRLERAEALSSARFVEARAQLVPESGACWITVAGAYAMFDGFFQHGLIRRLAGMPDAAATLIAQVESTLPTLVRGGQFAAVRPNRI